MATGKDQKITITSSSGLSKEDVERMAKEAEVHAADDKARREEIESKNLLDAMIYNVEKMLREHGDKISGSERGEVENAIADAKKAVDSSDKHQMDQARERLTQASHKLPSCWRPRRTPLRWTRSEGASESCFSEASSV